MDEHRSPTGAADELAEPVPDRTADSVESRPEDAAAVQELVQRGPEQGAPRTFVLRRSDPPAEWLERVRRDAPWLLAPEPAIRTEERPPEPISHPIPTATVDRGAAAPTAATPRKANVSRDAAPHALDQGAARPAAVEPPSAGGATLVDRRATSPPTAPGAVDTRPIPMEPGRPLAADFPGEIAPSQELDRTPGTDHMPEAASPSPRVLPGQSSAGATGVDGPDRTAAPASPFEPRVRPPVAMPPDEPRGAWPPPAVRGTESTPALDAVERPRNTDQISAPWGEGWPVQRRGESNGRHVVPPNRVLESTGGPSQNGGARIEWPATSRAISPSDSFTHDPATDVQERWVFEAAWPELPDDPPTDGAVELESALRARERWQRRLREQELA